MKIAARKAFVAIALLGTLATAATAAEKPRFFKLSGPAVEARAGAESTLKVAITPTDGYKWNLEFPTMLKLGATTDGLLEFPKQRLRKGDPEIAATAKGATLSLPFRAKGPGTTEVPLTLNFSVCTEKICHVYRGEKVAVKVTVQ